MSYTYLLEQGEESSAESFWDIPASVLSRSRNTLEKSYCNASETESCHDSRSGTTYKHSMAGHGAGASMSCVADSPVRTSARPAKVQASKVSGRDSGEKWPESLARYDRDSSLWRTRQCLLFEDSAESLETFPSWGIAQGGELWAVTPPGDALMESACGLSLMRPMAKEGYRHKFKLDSLIRKNHQDGNLSEQLARVHRVKLTPNACEILMGWPETWTDLKPLETGSVQSWLRSHGEF
jgi:hypothetical protein